MRRGDGGMLVLGDSGVCGGDGVCTEGNRLARRDHGGCSWMRLR